MKRIFEHPESLEKELSGPKYWRSLDEVAETPAFREYLEREFPEGASTLEGVDRRNFIKIMAASFALAGVGMAGCRRPERKILPYGRPVEDVVPGKPVFYATSMPLRDGALPLLVETHGNRPTKIEGNPSYSLSNGKSDLFSQASVLDLYDPDRSSRHLSDGATVTRDEMLARIEAAGAAAAGNGGAGLAFLAGKSGSPTRRRLVDALRERFPDAIWAEYESIDERAPARAASRLLGRPVRPFYRPSEARRIVTLDSDFVHAGMSHIAYGRGFADGRRTRSAQDEMNRLYAVESSLTVTGGMADHRLRLASGLIPAFAARLAAELFTQIEVLPEAVSALRAASEGLDETETWTTHKVGEWIRECVRDLAAHRGETLVVAGDHQPEAVHALVFAINQALGNVGNTVTFLEVEEDEAAEIGDLAEAIRAGGVNTLFVLGGNPAYDAPADLDWPALQERVGQVFRFGAYEDETSELANHHIAAAHYLESWGDARTYEGEVVAIQPMLRPLYDGLCELEVLAALAGVDERDPYELVRETVSGIARGLENGADFNRFLHDGLLEGTGYPVLRGSVPLENVAGIARELPAAAAPSAESLEVRFVRDATVDDGRFANNGWLQECPDPVTKLTWDNAIIISPRLARELGLEQRGGLFQVARKHPNVMDRGRQAAPVARLTLNGASVEGPIHVQPGMANYTVVLPLGYGRRFRGRVAHSAGFDAGKLRTSEHFHFASGGGIEILGRRTYHMANVQEHWSMEGRSIVREANLDHYREEPEFAQKMGMEYHAPPNYGDAKDMPIPQRVSENPRGMSLYKHPEMPGTNQWGMVIDLNTCTGCNACVIACQSENNVPIVGKDQVMRNREMHWMRIDRYFSSGSPDNREIADDPQITVQPMLCQHCDNAPCEVVCPVNATVQDHEGLNVMVYNRCIGTRYCANNCPYKVRRFNFFDWNERPLDRLYQGPLAPKGMPETLKMQKNPDVTVRMRGVMEKCTFCIQRINQAKIDQKVKAGASNDVLVPDGAFQVACQQACPTDAIVFGNLKDPDSEVLKLKESERNYSVLGYLNTRPRLTYLARVRNPNPAMPDYKSLPLSHAEYLRKKYTEGYLERQADIERLRQLEGGEQ